MTAATFELRGYQQDGNDAIAECFSRGVNRVLEKLPTGAGKTECFTRLHQHPSLAEWRADWATTDIDGRRSAILVIAHREELIDQAHKKYQRADPDLFIGVEQAQSYAGPFADVVLASIQTLNNGGECKRLLKLLEHYRFRLVIIDECHHAAALSYRQVLVHLGFLPPESIALDSSEEPSDEEIERIGQVVAEWDKVAPKDQLLLGVTATPNRTDAIGLGCVFQTIAYAKDLKWMIGQGYLVEPKPWIVDTTTNLSEVKISRGDFNQKQLAEAVNTPTRNQIGVRAWQQYAKDLSTICFTVDIAHAHAMADTFKSQGITAEAISSLTPKDDRRNMLRWFQERKILVLNNCAVLTEGTDLPIASCILHAKPTKSATLYEQMTGRGLRLYEGKTECIVIDLVDLSRKHSLQTAPVLFGLPPNLRGKDKTLTELEAEWLALQEKHSDFDFAKALANGPVDLSQLKVAAERYNVWNVPELGAEGKGLLLRWVKTGERYTISFPWGTDIKETVTVERDLIGRYSVSTTSRSVGFTYKPGQPFAFKPHDVKQSTVAADITDAHAALKLAEAYVKTDRGSAFNMRRLDQPWRKTPMSDNQRGVLIKRKIPFRVGITKGEASDLIDLYNARRGR